jgi:hypothetical protein
VDRNQAAIAAFNVIDAKGQVGFSIDEALY